ncbi:hypothetical protein [uncultured Roseobacter sp.]|uniref:hypothetical protein n=1 Tax=uncultured Roseobacter sp. TaxID=114847 RepID=UPI00261E3198|nr:hypothetical protein [uncultured Roseobacter sp.]
MCPQDMLTAALRDWDGASATALRAIYQQHHTEPDFTPALVAACQAPDTESAATWLIKHQCEIGGAVLLPEMCATVYAMLPKFTHWAARLHILQCVDRLPIPQTVADTVLSFVTQEATSTQKLIRAWSLYAAAQLAVQHPRYQSDAQALLAAAADPAPTGAVAVRLRKARALLDV